MTWCRIGGHSANRRFAVLRLCGTRLRARDADQVVETEPDERRMVGVSPSHPVIPTVFTLRQELLLTPAAAENSGFWNTVGGIGFWLIGIFG